MNKIFPLIEKITDFRLKELTIKCWEEAAKRGGWQKEDLDKIPFTLLPAKHMVSIVSHTNAVTSSAVAMGEVIEKAYPGAIKINMDILLSGGVLHDVGKVLEYAFENGVYVKSKTGKLIRHPVSGAALAWELGLPDEVVHVIASHSFEGDKTPRSIEGILIHHADFTNFEALGGKA
jgi:putative nucleotidyltransferase with HDIG domain